MKETIAALFFAAIDSVAKLLRDWFGWQRQKDKDRKKKLGQSLDDIKDRTHSDNPERPI